MGWLFLPCFYRLFSVLLPCCFRVVFESFSRCISNRLLMECTKTVDCWQRDRGGIARNREGNREADRERMGRERGGNGEGTGREQGGNGGFFTKLPYRIRFFLHMSRKSINFAGEFGEICFRFSPTCTDKSACKHRDKQVSGFKFQVITIKTIQYHGTSFYDR